MRADLPIQDAVFARTGSEKELAQFVALAQESYWENDYVGRMVGDSKLIYSYGTGDLIQRVKRCCRARTRCTDGPSLGTS